MLLSYKLNILGVIIIVSSVVFGFVLFDKILQFGIKDQTALKKRNEVRGIYLKLPFPLEFKIYFFNISNPVEVQNGAKPILKEVGPYCYDEFKEKVDVVDNESEDSLTYSPYDTFKFNQEKSGTLKEDDYVTILHPLIVGMVNKVTKESPAMLSIVNKAISSIFQDADSIYLTTRVRDILFDGVEINCKVTDFSAKAVCTQLKTQIAGLKESPLDKKIFLLSLLGPRNTTLGKRYKISRGISKSKDLGRLLEIDGKKEVTLWKTKECNRFKGTDGWIFPPLLEPEEGIWSFSADLCRSVKASYIKDTVFKGVNLRLYEADLGDMEHNEDEKCYCDTPKTCLKKGVFDLSKCLGMPVLVTLPHFLETNEIYSKQVEGLKPVREDHIIRIHFEALTGSPLEARKRIQFNLPISPNEKITLMKTIPEALHPIFWLEEGVELDGPLLNKVKTVFVVIKIIGIFRWASIGAGILVMIYGWHLYFKDKKEVKITPVHEGDSTKNGQPISAITNAFSENKSEELKLKGNVNPVMSGHEFDRY